MFKAIYMHTKPLKHAKHANTTELHQKTRCFQTFLQMTTFGKTFQKLPISYFACTFVWMFQAFTKIQNLLNMV